MKDYKVHCLRFNNNVYVKREDIVNFLLIQSEIYKDEASIKETLISLAINMSRLGEK